MPPSGPGTDAELLRVLLVEGEAPEARLIEEYLLRVRDRCYVVEWVDTLEAAIGRLRARDHDVCLANWQLREGTSEALLTLIKDEGLAIPLVVISGTPDGAVDARAQALGAANLLDKQGMNPGVLDRAIRYAQVRGQAESSLRRRAEHDELTGLARREMLMQDAQRALREVRRGQRWEVALLYVDLDRFKEVNDTLGHAVGDRVLQAVARRMERCLRPRDRVARLGGDEFAVLIQGRGAGVTARLARTRLQELLDTPMVLDGMEISLGASVGIAVDTQGQATVEELLGLADDDMYQDKLIRRASVPSTPPMDGPGSLIAALNRGEFQLAYQPMLDASTGWVLGLEALVRWNHPKQGLLRPSAFLRVAEQVGFMRLLGEWVLEKSCADLAEWERRCGSMVPGLRVNLTPDQFADELLTDALEEALERHGMRPHQLCLEVDEDALRGDLQGTVDRIKGIRSLGVRLCLDGYGRSGLELDLLARFPLDEVKLAPQVTAGIEVEPRRAIVIQGLLETCQRLHIEVSAKNVETEAQARALSQLQCARQQGYWYRRSMDHEHVLAYLVKQQNASA